MAKITTVVIFVSTVVAKISTVVIFISTVEVIIPNAWTNTSGLITKNILFLPLVYILALTQNYPAHLAYPTPKVKNLTCGIGGIGGLISCFLNIIARTRSYSRRNFSNG